MRGIGEKRVSHTPQLAGILAIGCHSSELRGLHTHTLKAAVLFSNPGAPTIHTLRLWISHNTDTVGDGTETLEGIHI